MTDVSKNIFIAGYYGFDNLGDEAILSAIIGQLKSKRSHLSFTVASGNPQKTSVDHNVNSVHWQDVASISEAVKVSDLVILGGGGLYNDAYDAWGNPMEDILTPRHKGINYYSAFPILAVLHNKPLVLFSLGIGPIITEHGKELTKLAFIIADLASVRDPLSWRTLKSLGVDTENVLISPDAAFGLTPDFEQGQMIFTQVPNNGFPGPVVGVCLRNWNINVSQAYWHAEVAKALDNFLEETRGRVIFITFQNSSEDDNINDTLTVQKVMRQMQHSKAIHFISNIPSPEIAAGIIAQCDIILGMRLHSLILAILTGIPAVGLSYDDKVTQLMKQFGIETYLLPISNFSNKKLALILKQAYTERYDLKNSLVSQVRGMKADLLKFLQTVLNVLEDAPPADHHPLFNEFLRKLSLIKFTRLALFETPKRSFLSGALSTAKKLKRKIARTIQRMV